MISNKIKYHKLNGYLNDLISKIKKLYNSTLFEVKMELKHGNKLTLENLISLMKNKYDFDGSNSYNTLSSDIANEILQIILNEYVEYYKLLEKYENYDIYQKPKEPTFLNNKTIKKLEEICF